MLFEAQEKKRGLAIWFSLLLSVLLVTVLLSADPLSPMAAAEDELLEKLKGIISLEDMPPGFRLTNTSETRKEKSRWVYFHYKGQHPFNIDVRIEEDLIPELSAAKKHEIAVQVRDSIVLTDVGIGERSYLSATYMGRGGAMSSQSITVLHDNWELWFRIMWYSERRVDNPMTDQAARTYLKNLAATVFNRLLGIRRKPLEIRPLGGDLEGNELSDGDVVLLVTDFDHPEGLPFEVSCEEGREIKIGLQNWHSHMVQVSGPGLEADGDGYKMKSSGGRVGFRLDFDSQALKDYRENFPGGPAVVIPVDIEAAADKRTLFIQLTPWELIITRFEIRQRGSESTRADAVRGTRVVEPYEFNEHIAHMGKLWDTWDQKLHPEVKTVYDRDIAANRPVIMGWGVDEATYAGFYTAQFDRDGRLDEVPAFNAEADLIAEFDLEIWRDPKVETVRDPNMDEWNTDTEKKVNNWKLQEELWREYWMDEFQLTVHEVDPTGQNMRLAAVPRSYFLRPEDESRLNRGAELTSYVNLKELTEEGQLVHKGHGQGDMFAAPYPCGPLRNSGIYEIRLKIKVILKSNQHDFREVDVAIRIKALKGGFDVRRLEWTSRRWSNIR